MAGAKGSGHREAECFVTGSGYLEIGTALTLECDRPVVQGS